MHSSLGDRVRHCQKQEREREKKKERKGRKEGREGGREGRREGEKKKERKGCGGMCLQSQLLRRQVGESFEPGRQRLQ